MNLIFSGENVGKCKIDGELTGGKWIHLTNWYRLKRAAFIRRVIYASRVITEAAGFH